MEPIKYSDLKPDQYSASAMTWGMFDGVHLGHQKILRTLLEQARTKNLPAIAMTFEPHPREVLGISPHVPDIIPLSERCRLIKAMGVDALILIEFTREFANKTADEFLGELIIKLHPEFMVIGHDFRFGRGREADGAWLRTRKKEHRFQLIIVPAVTVSGEVVSSSRIRNSIQSGDMEKAALLLGRPFSVEGQVIHGHHRGKKMGFATANLRWNAELIPRTGVYVAKAEFPQKSGGDARDYPAVVNVGFNPTFGDDKIAIEAYLLDFDGDLYQKRVRISFLRRLRDEMKFDSVEALTARIRDDVAQARRYMGRDS
jgi:riboflavin kinase/FMN adenylyltransferase